MTEPARQRRIPPPPRRQPPGWDRRNPAEDRPRRWTPRPPVPLTPEELERFRSAPPDVQRCLLWIVHAREVTGKGPRLNELWSVWHYGTPDRPAREGDPWIVSKLDGKTRPPKADAQHLLRHLGDQWFVRFSVDTPGSIKVRGHVYALLAPFVKGAPVPAHWVPRGSRQGRVRS